MEIYDIVIGLENFILRSTTESTTAFAYMVQRDIPFQPVQLDHHTQR